MTISSFKISNCATPSFQTRAGNTPAALAHLNHDTKINQRSPKHPTNHPFPDPNPSPTRISYPFPPHNLPPFTPEHPKSLDDLPTRELFYDRGFGYSDRGELIGHLVEGAIMLHDKAQQMMRETGTRLPAGALTVLQHIIISHHERPEYGAAKVPSSPEAVLVSLIDNLDAKTVLTLAAARPDRENTALGGNFTEKNWALNTKVFKPDPLR